jgi:hypothetical protein
MRGKEDYRRTWDGVKMSTAELQIGITELKSSNNQKDSLIASLEARIAALQQQLSESSINSL